MAIVISQELFAKILTYLGYTSLANNLDPLLFDSDNSPAVPWSLLDGQIRLEANLGQIRNDDFLALLEDLVANITNIRTQIQCAAANLAVLGFDGIRINNHQIDQLWRLDYQYCCMLAVRVGMKVRYHPTQSGGYGMRVAG